MFWPAAVNPGVDGVLRWVQPACPRRRAPPRSPNKTPPSVSSAASVPAPLNLTGTRRRYQRWTGNRSRSCRTFPDGWISVGHALLNVRGLCIWHLFLKSLAQVTRGWMIYSRHWIVVEAYLYTHSFVYSCRHRAVFLSDAFAVMCTSAATHIL